MADPADEGPSNALRTIIERAQAGNAAAFDQLIVFCQRKVVSTAWYELVPAPSKTIALWCSPATRCTPP